MAVEVLRRAVQRQIGTELQRLLIARRQERVVDDVHRLRCLGNFRDRCNIRQLHRRVCRRFGQEQFRVLAHRRFYLRRVRGIRKRELDAEAAEHFRAQAVSATVGNVGNDRVIASAQERQHRAVHRRHAGRETGRIRAAFEFGQFFLQRAHGRVAGTRIGIAFLQIGVDRFLDEGRRLVDRGQDAAGGRVGRDAGVNLFAAKPH